MASTSARTWVERITVRSSPRRVISLRISTRWFGSRPSVGSSRTRISGWWRIAAASPTRWRNPLDSSEIGRVNTGPIPVRSTASARACRKREPVTPLSSPA